MDSAAFISFAVAIIGFLTPFIGFILWMMRDHTKAILSLRDSVDNRLAISDDNTHTTIATTGGVRAPTISQAAPAVWGVTGLHFGRLMPLASPLSNSSTMQPPRRAVLSCGDTL